MAENWLWSEIPVNICDDERDGSGVMCVVTPPGQTLTRLVLVPVPALEMRHLFSYQRQSINTFVKTETDRYSEPRLINRHFFSDFLCHSFALF